MQQGSTLWWDYTREIFLLFDSPPPCDQLALASGAALSLGCSGDQRVATVTGLYER